MDILHSGVSRRELCVPMLVRAFHNSTVSSAHSLRHASVFYSARHALTSMGEVEYK